MGRATGQTGDGPEIILPKLKIREVTFSVTVYFF